MDVPPARSGPYSRRNPRSRIEKRLVTECSLVPLDRPADALREAYTGVLTDSDVRCLVGLYEQGLIKVERDGHTNVVVVSPSLEVADFIESVFVPD